MQMMMQMTVQHCIQQQLCLELQLTGGSTTSIFPEVEKWLQQSSDHEMALLYVSKRNNGWQDRYVSVVDFLYAQVVPGGRAQCSRYYRTDNEEHTVRYLITMQERNFFARQMILALEIAYQCWQEKRYQSWASIRETVVYLAAA